MGIRVVHVITGDCEIHVQKSNRQDQVRIRMRETDPDNPDAADFEVEGTAEVLREVFSSLNMILENIDAMGRETH